MKEIKTKNQMINELIWYMLSHNTKSITVKYEFKDFELVLYRQEIYLTNGVKTLSLSKIYLKRLEGIYYDLIHPNRKKRKKRNKKRRNRKWNKK